jgi:hypothetical protein
VRDPRRRKMVVQRGCPNKRNRETLGIVRWRGYWETDRNSVIVECLRESTLDRVNDLLGSRDIHSRSRERITPCGPYAADVDEATAEEDSDGSTSEPRCRDRQ